MIEAAEALAKRSPSGRLVTWWTAFVLAVSHLRVIVRRPRALMVIDAVSGIALLGIGGALVLIAVG